MLVNEPMANRLNLRVGDTLRIQTDRGEEAFPIAGITVDFDVRSVVFMDDAVYRQWYDDRSSRRLRSSWRPASTSTARCRRFAPTWPASRSCWCVPNRGIARECAEVFDCTFTHPGAAIPGDHRLSIGILSTPREAVIERRRIGVAPLAWRRRQLAPLAAGTGLVVRRPACFAMPTGFVLAVIPIYHHQPALLRLDAGDVAGAGRVHCVGFVAGAAYWHLPGVKIGNTPPAIAVRSE